MNQAQVKTELQTMLSDTLSQIDDSRLTQAVSQAWKDKWIANPVWDESLTFSSSSYSYAIPSTLTSVEAIYIKPASDSFPQEIGAELWEVIGDDIVFSQDARNCIPSSTALQIRGRYKIASGDSITDEVLQNYVINLSALIVLKQLSISRVLSFLKNDTTLAEVLRLKADIEGEVARYRQQIQTSFVNG